MRQIETIIDPLMFQDVREALARVGVTDIVLSDVRCTDVRGSHTEFYRGLAYRVDLVPKLRLEVVIDDYCVDEVVKALTAAVIVLGGVGRVLIVPVEQGHELGRRRDPILPVRDSRSTLVWGVDHGHGGVRVVKAIRPLAEAPLAWRRVT